MKTEKPVVELKRMINWIRCPMKNVWKDRIKKPVYDYESLLRMMLLNTLKAGYGDPDVCGKPGLERHTSNIWEYLLSISSFPDPGATLRKMNEFYGLRCNCLEKLDLRFQDADNTLNTFHWWDNGLCFDRDYYALRNEINEFQSLLGFPDWNLVRTFYREDEYAPVTLADTFCDYMNAVKVFSLRDIPDRNIRFDVPAYLDLKHVRLRVSFDIMWKREKIYKAKNTSLKPGTVAEQMVPLSEFSDVSRIQEERLLMRDIRMPVIGAAYRLCGSEERIRIDSVNCFIPTGRSGVVAWRETDSSYDRETRDVILGDLDYYASAYLNSERQGFFLPANLIKNSACASCSYLSMCFRRNLSREYSASAEAEEKENGYDAEFFADFSDRASLCDDRIKAMNLLKKSALFLKDHHSPKTVRQFCNVIENLKRDFILEGVERKNAVSEKEI